MLDYLLACGVIFVVLYGWLSVQALYRRFANNNPQLGPFREEGGGCGGSCSCSGGSCKR